MNTKLFENGIMEGFLKQDINIYLMKVTLYLDLPKSQLVIKERTINLSKSGGREKKREESKKENREGRSFLPPTFLFAHFFQI